MKICPQCKQKYAANAYKCWTCGAALKQEDANLYKWLAISTGGIVLLLFGGLIGIAVIGSKMPKPAVAVKPTAPSPTAQQKKTPASTPDRSAENARGHLDSFRSKVSSIDTDGTIISSISTGISPDQAKITVNNVWHYQPYQVRLQMAQGLWNAWANIHAPNDPDKARIKIVDQMDNEVGGSRMLAGSLIWVAD